MRRLNHPEPFRRATHNGRDVQDVPISFLKTLEPAPQCSGMKPMPSSTMRW